VVGGCQDKDYGFFDFHTQIYAFSQNWPPGNIVKPLPLKRWKRTSGHQKKPLMPEPKRTGQHQEPGKERQDTQVVSLPNPTHWCSRIYDKNKEPLRPIMKEDLGSGSFFICY
jgi:hypothetical protein